MEKIVTTVCKLSHKQFRALLKKFRRKRIRQKLAQERERIELLEQQKKENSPGFRERQEEIRRNSELYEQFEEKESIRQHKLWLRREEQAQAEFKRKQQQLEIERIKREEERKRILEEFERQEYVEKQAEEEVQKLKSQKEEALQEALSNLSEVDGDWHNPIGPRNYNVPENYQIGLEREQCMFFSKTGCCRFGDRCSRGHTRPDRSTTILIKGMYSHFSIDQTGRDDYDTDIALEYEDKECYQDFKNFYCDVLPEFKKFGKVIQFKVCNNFEPHLRGNVYVQYSREEEAIEAYKNFNGRYYAGKQISCDYTHVISWRSAICGLHGRNLCPKGINCNFLHVFKNPNDEFWEANRDLPPRENHNVSNSSRKRDYSKDDRYSYHISEHRHRSSKHESRSDRYGSRSDRHEPKRNRHESRNNRHESKSDRHESRNDKYDSRSDRHDSKSDRHDSRSDRHNSRSDRHNSDFSEEDSQSTKYQNVHKSKHRKRLRDSSSSSKSDSPEYSSKKNQSHKKHKKKKSKKHRKEDDNWDWDTE